MARRARAGAAAGGVPATTGNGEVGGLPALPSDWAAELASFATEAAAVEVVGGASIISLKGGRFTYNDQELPNPLAIVALDAAYDNAWYDSAFEDGAPQSPACFAIGKDINTLVPSEASPRRQGGPQPDVAVENPTCAGCWANAFRSDDRGKGKACRNYRRLLVMSADDLAPLKEGSLNVETPLMKLPPTALKSWAEHVKGLERGIGGLPKLPPFAVVSEIELVPSGGAFTAEARYHSTFAGDRDLVRRVMDLRTKGQETLMSPYPQITADAAGAPAQEPRKTRSRAPRAPRATAAGATPPPAPAAPQGGFGGRARSTAPASGKRPATPAAGVKY